MNHQGGVPIRYGQPERWKLVAEQIGRTKPNRAPDAADRKRKKNDGRPPDTSKELLNLKQTKTRNKKIQQVIASLSDKPGNLLGYPWKDNSCWLDTLLDLMFRAVSQDFQTFSDVCQILPKNSPFQVVFRALDNGSTPYTGEI
jgi:hypothetical protein